MPNKNSKADHIPIRTCVVCRKKSAQKELLAFVLFSSGIVYDIGFQLNARKCYVCPQASCLAQLGKWRKKRAKHRLTK
jgi:predicted RNA-binding protein YlxR (DUF448 family)